MGKIDGFLTWDRTPSPHRLVEERLKDFNEVSDHAPEGLLRRQGGRCMDCGTPFCQSATGCPIDNLIPEWNDFVYRGRWKQALERLVRTNPFPEFTGRVCPAPCEGSCVLGSTDPAVTIKDIEHAVIDQAFASGWVEPRIPRHRTDRRIAIVGSGPAGLAAADHLNQTGHRVTVYERADRPGGLLMYGIPNMKLDKRIVQRRIDLLEAEGVRFETGITIGEDLDPGKLLSERDALLLATGSTIPRDLPVSGRDLDGIHFAMEFLTGTTRGLLNGEPAPISAKGKNVVVIGGGDTGTDCIATALRQGCDSVVNFELLPQPPAERAPDNPWPEWPRILRTDYGHHEATGVQGNDPRVYNILTREVLPGEKGRVGTIKTINVTWEDGPAGRRTFKETPGTEKEWKADLVLLALGFTGTDPGLAQALGLDLTGRGSYDAQPDRFETSTPGCFAAGDCRRGQSLVVWAMREGMDAARTINRHLRTTTRRYHRAGSSVRL